MRRISATAVLAVFLAGALAAQPTIAPGTRVRVAGRDMLFPDGAPHRIGTVTSSQADGFVLQPEGRSEMLMLRFTDLTRVDVSQGRKNRKVRGAVVGGLVTGGAFVSLACAFSNGSCEIGNHVGGFLAYYAVGAIPGVIGGAVIGSRMKGPERWRPVWTTPPSVALRPGQ